MILFEYEDYKQFVNDWVKNHPKNGYGIYSKIAEFLKTNSVIISQIFSGSRDLSLEQAAKLSKFMSLSALETDYFLLLVQLDRAGTNDLKAIINRQLKDIKEKRKSIKNRIEHQQLDDNDKALFYSSWYYIATWLAAPIQSLNSIPKIAKHFSVPEHTISEVIRFLIEKGLLQKKGEKFVFGTNVVHVPHDSPFVSKHHLNWRMKAIQIMDTFNPDNLHYTAPMSLSEELKKQIREELIQLIQKYTKLVAASESETLVCLNFDLFEY